MPVGSERQAPPSNTGTTRPSHARRSLTADPAALAPRRVVTVLVTVFLARADFRWLAVAKARDAPQCAKAAATGAI